MDALTKDTFQNQVASFEGISVVGFFAPWCGPCRAFKPVIEELSQENSNAQIRYFHVNVDENEELVREYQVSAFPTLVLFKDGQEVRRFVGASPKEKVSYYIEELDV